MKLAMPLLPVSWIFYFSDVPRVLRQGGRKYVRLGRRSDSAGATRRGQERTITSSSQDRMKNCDKIKLIEERGKTQKPNLSGQNEKLSPAVWVPRVEK